MDSFEIKKMYNNGYTIDYIAKRYCDFMNSKVQQNYFNTEGNLVISQRYSKRDAYDFVYNVIYDYYMGNLQKAD